MDVDTWSHMGLALYTNAWKSRSKTEIEVIDRCTYTHVKLSRSYLSCCSVMLFISSLTRVTTKLRPQVLSAAEQADVTPLSDANEPQLILKALLMRRSLDGAVRWDSPPQRNSFFCGVSSCFPPKHQANAELNLEETQEKLTSSQYGCRSASAV